MAETEENDFMFMEQEVEDDELADFPVTKRPRVTPRASLASLEANHTPYANLRALAGLIRITSTPAQRPASSVGTAFSAAKGTANTPSLQPRTTPRVRRPLQQIGGDGIKPATPHTIRALQQRRTTPGQDRRKSGRTQRETPRDALRNLSKILARSSKPFTPSYQSAELFPGIFRATGLDDFQDELSPEQPQLTNAIEVEEEGGADESSLINQPTLSIPLEEEELNIKSIEMSRRGSVQDEEDRHSRGDVRSIPASENIERSMESIMNESHGDIGEYRQWQKIKDEIENFPESRYSGAELRHLVHKSSEHLETVERNQLEQSMLTAAYSPFVFRIPGMELHDPAEQLPEYSGLLAEDIQQFGTPIPIAEAIIPPMPEPDTMKRPAPKATFKSKRRTRAPRVHKLSTHGMPCPSLPLRIVKNISSTFVRSTGKKTGSLSKESMRAILDASDRFFEQFGSDLAAASIHAGRKTIDESDVVTVMQRQRQVCARASEFSLGVRYLPSEALAEMRASIPKPDRFGKQLKIA